MIVERQSIVDAPSGRVWERIVTPEGINDELRPWMTMSMPRGAEALTVDNVPVGTPVGRCWMRLFGVLPFDYDQLMIAGGYDHNFVLDGDDSDEPVLAARVVEPRSGRVLEVFTTEPGVQFYTGNGIHHGLPGKGGHVYAQHAAFALETQHFPDSPNHPEFPSTVLRPGQEYRSRTVYRFSVV